MTIDGFIVAVARKVRKTGQKGFLYSDKLVRFDSPFNCCPLEFLVESEPGTALDAEVRRRAGLTRRQVNSIIDIADNDARVLARAQKPRRAALLRACGIRESQAGRS